MHIFTICHAKIALYGKPLETKLGKVYNRKIITEEKQVVLNEKPI